MVKSNKNLVFFFIVSFKGYIRIKITIGKHKIHQILVQDEIKI